MKRVKAVHSSTRTERARAQEQTRRNRQLCVQCEHIKVRLNRLNLQPQVGIWIKEGSAYGA